MGLNFAEWFYLNEMPYSTASESIEVNLPKFGKYRITGIDFRIEDWEEPQWKIEKRKFLRIGTKFSAPLKEGWLVNDPGKPLFISDKPINPLPNPQWAHYVVLLDDSGYVNKPIKYPRPGEPGYDSSIGIAG